LTGFALTVVLLLVLVPLAAAAPPNAVDDSVTTAEETTLDDIAVLANDTDPEMGQLTIDSFTQPANGTVSAGTAPDTLKYVPGADFNGADTFTYTAEDPALEQDIGTVNVTVTEVNDAPTAVGDSYSAVTSAGATFDVRTNDSPGPANESTQTLAVSIVTPPPTGTAVVNPNGTVTYMPSSFAGNVAFTYSVCDNGTTNGVADRKCANATVTLDVLPALSVADPDVAEGDSGAATAVFPVSLNAAYTKAVTVSYATANDTAFSGADYQATTGQLTFAPGEIARTVDVGIVGDSAVEPDETFFLDLSAPVNATIADARGAALIRNDDSGGCDITGTPRADRLVGTAESETICGLGGNDRIDGGGGDDIISGGAGNDVIQGGAGSDTITGGAGDDLVLGGTGDDAIDGDAGNDTIAGDGGGDAIEGGSGNDRATGGVGSDTIDGDAGNDVIRGGAGADNVDGGGGNDRLSGDGDADRVDGAAGSDRVSGDEGNDWVDGGPGDDSGRGAGVFGGPGNDTLRGEGGDDLLVPGNGNDTILGGGGTDLVLYARARGGVSVDLTRGRATGGDGRDRVTTVEDVTGSRFADTLVGNSAANVLSGGAGDDRLFGRGGRDTLLGGAGRDVLNGEGGGDSCNVGPGGGTTTSC
jgi:Ca2+-binding RTX toxin-like protein